LLLCHKNQFLRQYLLLTCISTSKVVLDTIYNTYERDLSDKVTYDKEVLRWKAKRARAAEQNGLLETMEITNSSRYSSYNACVHCNARAVI